MIYRSYWDVDLVLFDLEWSEAGIEVRLFVWHEDCSAWLKLHFILVLVWDSPFKFKRDTRFILYSELLLGGNTHIGRWEENLA